jgi:hypothetical protein
MFSFVLCFSLLSSSLCSFICFICFLTFVLSLLRF